MSVPQIEDFTIENNDEYGAPEVVCPACYWPHGWSQTVITVQAAVTVAQEHRDWHAQQERRA